MPIETIEHNGNYYPAFQSRGNAAKYVMEFAKEVCKGDIIYDIGYANDDWKFPCAIGIDVKDGNGYDAMNLPNQKADSIFASHLLEHTERPFEVLEYWHSMMKDGATLFLYLPNMDYQSYHRCWSNKKHLNYTNPHIMRLYFSDNDTMWGNVFVSERDLYDSFCCIATKKPISSPKYKIVYT